MKNNASLRLAKAALACALFGTMFTSCSKEEDILPNSQISVLTDDSREDRTKGFVLEEKQGHTLSYNNEQYRIRGSAAGDVYTGGGKLIGKPLPDRCLEPRANEIAKAETADNARR